MNELSPTLFLRHLKAMGIQFYAGVPDSLLKDFCLELETSLSPNEHLIAANEGAAVAASVGHYLATGSLPLVYLQNSGLGNTINPLVSLADPQVYGIPMVLMIGWRGEPGVADEPQHEKQGATMQALLDAVGVPHVILEREPSAAHAQMEQAYLQAEAINGPVAILVRKGTFARSSSVRSPHVGSTMTRERAIALLAQSVHETDAIVATTGMISRELYEYRLAEGNAGLLDFLTVGSMGHASQIALGIATGQPTRRVICLDGDGALLMHMGAMPIIGARQPRNLIHVVLNNGAHDSVGGQPTVALDVDLPAVARACGYTTARMVCDEDALGAVVADLSTPGPHFLEVQVKQGHRSDLGRPQRTPREARIAFEQAIRALR